MVGEDLQRRLDRKEVRSGAMLESGERDNNGGGLCYRGLIGRERRPGDRMQSEEEARVAEHHGTDGGGNGDHGGAPHGKENQRELVYYGGCEVEKPEVKKNEGERVQRGGDKGALPLYPKVFDSDKQDKEGAL